MITALAPGRSNWTVNPRVCLNTSMPMLATRTDASRDLPQRCPRAEGEPGDRPLLLRIEQGRIPLLASVQQAEAARAAALAPRPYQPMGRGRQLPHRGAAPAVWTPTMRRFQGRSHRHHPDHSSGALKIGADLLKRYFPTSEVWVSNPTLGTNHKAMFEGPASRCTTIPTTTRPPAACSLTP